MAYAWWMMNAIRLLFSAALVLICNSQAATKEFTLVIARAQENRRQPKGIITINGTVPGPTLYADVNDVIAVTVINELGDDSTEVHWHGVSVIDTPWADGTAPLTQCPISPALGNNSFTYTFKAQSSGTFWYHGHLHSQYPDGLYGALIITDVAETTLLDDRFGLVYDTDELVLQMADYYDEPTISVLNTFLGPNTFGYDPVPDAHIVNNLFTDDMVVSMDRNQMQRVRIVNAATHSYFDFSVDGLPLVLLEVDGVLVEPMLLSSLKLFPGQRASVMLDWTLWNTSFFSAESCAVSLRVDLLPFVYPQYDPKKPNDGLFGTVSKQPLDMHWRGMVRFNDSEQCSAQSAQSLWSALNQTDRTTYFSPNDTSVLTSRDFNLLEAIPVDGPDPPGDADFGISLQTQLYAVNVQQGIVRAFINGATYTPVLTTGTLNTSAESAEAPQERQERYVNPWLYDILSGRSADWTPNILTPDDPNIIPLINGDAVTPFVLPHLAVIDIFIDGACCGAHPFHLHGHHFWIIATSQSPNYYDDNKRQGRKILRRDVVTVPDGGWVWLRLVADNPGVWLLHCHFHWHFAMGMAAVFIEAPDILAENGRNGTWRVPQQHQNMCLQRVVQSNVSAESGTLTLSPAQQSDDDTTTSIADIPTVTPTEAPTTSDLNLQDVISLPISIPFLDDDREVSLPTVPTVTVIVTDSPTPTGIPTGSHTPTGGAETDRPQSVAPIVSDTPAPTNTSAPSTAVPVEASTPAPTSAVTATATSASPVETIVVITPAPTVPVVLDLTEFTATWQTTFQWTLLQPLLQSAPLLRTTSTATAVDLLSSSPVTLQTLSITSVRMLSTLDSLVLLDTFLPLPSADDSINNSNTTSNNSSAEGETWEGAVELVLRVYTRRSRRSSALTNTNSSSDSVVVIVEVIRREVYRFTSSFLTSEGFIFNPDALPFTIAPAGLRQVTQRQVQAQWRALQTVLQTETETDSGHSDTQRQVLMRVSNVTVLASSLKISSTKKGNTQSTVPSSSNRVAAGEGSIQTAEVHVTAESESAQSLSSSVSHSTSTETLTPQQPAPLAPFFPFSLVSSWSQLTVAMQCLLAGLCLLFVYLISCHSLCSVHFYRRPSYLFLDCCAVPIEGNEDAIEGGETGLEIEDRDVEQNQAHRENSRVVPVSVVVSSLSAAIVSERIRTEDRDLPPVTTMIVQRERRRQESESERRERRRRGEMSQSSAIDDASSS